MLLTLKDICIGIVEEINEDYSIQRFELMKKVMEYNYNNNRIIIYKNDDTNEYYYDIDNEDKFFSKSKYFINQRISRVSHVKSIYDILKRIAEIIKEENCSSDVKKLGLSYETLLNDYNSNTKYIDYDAIDNNFDDFVENYCLAFGNPIEMEDEELFTLIDGGKRK